ncbi:hypothetical protein BDV11DRAFT_122551 [Aspergillus similis]
MSSELSRHSLAVTVGLVFIFGSPALCTEYACRRRILMSFSLPYISLLSDTPLPTLTCITFALHRHVRIVWVPFLLFLSIGIRAGLIVQGQGVIPLGHG